MPTVTGVLETALYVDEMGRAMKFYDDLFGFKKMAHDARFCAYSVGEHQILLLFKRGAMTDSHLLADGLVPPHDGNGPVHMAFSVEATELEPWEKRLCERKIQVESRIHWPLGGQSIYFRDPDKHLLEFVTPGCWPIY